MGYECAYELLIKKIEIAEKKELKTKVSKQRDAKSRSSGRSSRGGNSATQRSIIRELMSPTMIRSVLGILGKMMQYYEFKKNKFNLKTPSIEGLI
jgi:F0F1-type ATP synthase assembly protein I